MVKFSEVLSEHLKDSKREWMNAIPPDTQLTIDEYPFGHVVAPTTKSGRSEEGKSISILLGDTAEIIEEYFLRNDGYEQTCAGIRAYRPVRLVEKGDILGDFSVLDRFTFEEDKFLGNLSRPFENWKIAYGRRAGIIIPVDDSRATLDKIHNRLYSSEFHSSDYSGPSPEHFGAHNLLRQAMPTTIKVACLRLDSLDEDVKNNVIYSIFRNTSWKRSYTYRICLNSYNVGERFKFSFGAKLATHCMYGESRNEAGRKFSHRVNYDDIIDIFTDALYDSINRPMREEPVFGRGLIDKAGMFEVLQPVRISKNPQMREFFFPVGISNFLILNFAQSHDKVSKIRSGLSHTKPRADAKTIGDGTVFWEDVANKIIDFHVGLPESIDRLDLSFMKFPRGMTASAYKKILRDEWRARFCQVLCGYEYDLIVVDTYELFGGRELYLRYSRR